MVFSVCEWGGSKPWYWAAPVGNLWRTTSDITPNWDRILELFDKTVPKAWAAKPGAWNDPDMLEVGATLKSTDHGLTADGPDDLPGRRRADPGQGAGRR